MKQVVFEETCPACGKKNRVTVQKREDGFNDKQEFFCAFCGAEIGSVGAAETPKTEAVEK